jgi:hypothetical protein
MVVNLPPRPGKKFRSRNRWVTKPVRIRFLLKTFPLKREGRDWK